MSLALSTPTGTGYATGPVAVTASPVTMHTNGQTIVQSPMVYVHALDGIVATLVTVVWGGVTLTREMTEGESWPIGPMALGPGLAITITAAATSRVVAGIDVRSYIAGA